MIQPLSEAAAGSTAVKTASTQPELPGTVLQCRCSAGSILLRMLGRCLLLVALLVPVIAQSGESDKTVLVVGDSISAAYGIEEHRGWVALLQEELDQSLQDQPLQIRVVNASISGDTTDGGLRRLPEALARYSPAVVIIELGGNDGLRGQSLKQLRENLAAMIRLSQQQQASVLILGMRIPTNYGSIYTERFAKSFERVANETGAWLIPFFLQPIAEDITWFQPDGVHPNADAQPLLMKPVFDKLLDMLGADPSDHLKP